MWKGRKIFKKFLRNNSLCIIVFKFMIEYYLSFARSFIEDAINLLPVLETITAASLDLNQIVVKPLVVVARVTCCYCRALNGNAAVCERMAGYTSLNSDLSIISEWGRANIFFRSLSQKFNFIIFSLGTAFHSNLMTLNCLPRAQKYFWLFFTTNPNWKCHILSIAKTTIKLGILYRLSPDCFLRPRCMAYTGALSCLVWCMLHKSVGYPLTQLS